MFLMHIQDATNKLHNCSRVHYSLLLRSNIYLDCACVVLDFRHLRDHGSGIQIFAAPGVLAVQRLLLLSSLLARFSAERAVVADVMSWGEVARGGVTGCVVSQWHQIHDLGPHRLWGKNCPNTPGIKKVDSEIE